MATNEIAPGKVFDYTATAAITSSQPILMGDILGVAVTDAAIGDVVAVDTCGVYEINKRITAGATFAQGVKVYWDAANSRVDNTDNTGTNKHIGWAYKAGLVADATLQVKLLG